MSSMTPETLIIAEKRELAAAIVAAVFPKNTHETGYYDCGGGVAATYCFGHLLELDPPEAYDERLAKWTMATLPFFFDAPRRHPKTTNAAKKQFALIAQLLKSAKTVIHAGDPDAEGQTIVDEILEFTGFKGEVKRLLINDNTPALVKKAWDSMPDNSKYDRLRLSAQARQYADWLYGMNATRLFRLAAEAEGFSTAIVTKKGEKRDFSIGRVATPIFGMVVNRTRAHQNHEKSWFWKVTGTFQFAGAEFPARLIPAADAPVDAEGRLANEDYAKKVAGECEGQSATAVSVETKTVKEQPPLPYNLIKLQADCARLYNLKPDFVLDITQGLRDKHQLITYNRSDCQYLSDEQHPSAPEVLVAVANNAPELVEAVQRADPAIKSRAFDSKKVSAHHAIIPQNKRVEQGKLSVEELRVYHLIACAYVAQFLPPAEYEQTKATITVAGHTFAATASTLTAPGWKAIYGKGELDDADEEKDDDAPADASLKNVPAGATGKCGETKAEKGATKPLPLYTMSSLLLDLTRVARYVKDERIRKLLLEKDKDKEGESGGIGTPATRSDIIAKLFEQQLITEKKSGKTANIVPTEQALSLFDALPADVTSVDMTALWFDEQRQIEEGAKEPGEFYAGLMRFIEGLCSKVKADGLGLCQGEAHKCPKCGALLRRMSAKNGTRHFWGCTNYPDCGYTAPDDDGKPGERAAPDENAPKCPDCGKPMAKRKSAKGEFWGCTGFPECKTIMDVGPNGEPVAKAPQPEITADAPKCPKCGKPMLRRVSKSGSGYWWGCTGWKDGCDYTAPDVDGKPGERKERPAADPNAPKCPKCGKPMRRRHGGKGDFWGCSDYPRCTETFDIGPDGKPVKREKKEGEKSGKGSKKSKA